MLILTRNIGQRILIDNDTVIAILDVCGQQVRIGIEAPPEKEIHREEIYNKIRLERGEAPYQGAAITYKPKRKWLEEEGK